MDERWADAGESDRVRDAAHLGGARNRHVEDWISAE